MNNIQQDPVHGMDKSRHLQRVYDGIDRLEPMCEIFSSVVSGQSDLLSQIACALDVVYELASMRGDSVMNAFVNELIHKVESVQDTGLLIPLQASLPSKLNSINRQGLYYPD